MGDGTAVHLADIPRPQSTTTRTR